MRLDAEWTKSIFAEEGSCKGKCNSNVNWLKGGSAWVGGHCYWYQKFGIGHSSALSAHAVFIVQMPVLRICAPSGRKMHIQIRY